MGYMSARDMAEQTDLDTALSWHLTANHFPPVPVTLVPACKEAIQAILDEEPDRLIDLPDEITYRDLTLAPAYAIAEAHHLDAFIVASWDD